MMHALFVPWLIEKRAKKGLKSVMIGTSSCSAFKFFPNFAAHYVSTKTASSNISRAIAAEVKDSKYSKLLDVITLYPGGTDTGIFNRPEATRYHKMRSL